MGVQVRGVLVQVLGPVRGWRDGQELDLGPAGRRAVLGLLVLARGHPLPRAELIDALWGDHPPPTAANILQTHVKHLRRQLEPDRRPHSPSTVLPGVGDGYALRLSSEQVDLGRFRTLVGAATAAQRTGDVRGAAVLSGEALALWRGNPMADVPLLADHPKVLALTRERQAAQARYCDAMLELGAGAEVLSTVAEMAAGQPFDEEAQARLIRAYHALGQRAQAFAAYRTVRRRLADELGVDPGPVLAAAHAALLHQPAPDRPVPTGTEPDPPAGAEVGAAPPDPVPAPTPTAVPRQLPADVYGFTGREAELRHLDQLLAVEYDHEPAPAPEDPTDPPSTVAAAAPTPAHRSSDATPAHRSTDAPPPVVIVAICGTAGVGKTALAVHWAHRLRARFPAGQLYVNLRGHDDGQPMPAGDALARLLAALGVPSDEIPLDLDERAARYRTELTDRAMLVVLDNAASVEQVRPLLPGTAPGMALVTSRDTLAGLVALHGARRLALEPLPPADAVGLLRLLVGPRAEAEPQAVTELAEQCARLPLALRVAAELAGSRPDDLLADLVGELADHRRRVRLLDTGGDPRGAVRTVFSWSYRHLAPADAVLFRRLGLHPGADIGTYAAAALAGLDVTRAERILAVLARAHLIQSTGRSRWVMHDLLRAYAAEVCGAEDPEPERAVALTRLLDHYLATAATAMDALYPAERHHRPEVRRPEADERVPVPPIDDRDAARNWLDTERAALVAVCGFAATQGWPGHVVSLANTLYRYLESGHHLDALDIHTQALHAARRSGDEAGQAHALTSLGAVHRLRGRYADAIEHHERALVMHHRGGDRYGQARTRSNLGIVYERLGQRDPAIEHQREALDLYGRLGDRYGEAGALTNLGNVYSELGRYDEAAELLSRSLDLFRVLGDRVGEAIGLCNLGDVQRELGRYDEAAATLRRSLGLFREAGHRNGEATALSNLGRVQTGLGRYDLAAEELGQALAWFQETGHRYGEASVLNSLGDALYAGDHLAEAGVRYRAALAIAVETGDRDEQARAHLGLAQVDRAGTAAPPGPPGPAGWPGQPPLSGDFGLSAPGRRH
ncbi:AfsR/SARP family transcriptional regulator [Plantactinospora soyae]|uniref:DNA-binding SARP family transcriptional activator/predicted negative regulator of RcsB-dependent stress response n=1 Tax=Plantactinospora soyae TaxID=1544732 RepID=A0A927R2H7_9ACTN|nr:tetratricopeptide repeat protein [Plantactinospora soyae]MBE1484559.1 DNA-binding SARP family transcriptional activator/predicted negative regulator of RcsB-dependent stress response [Plantactinospora soyae]